MDSRFAQVFAVVFVGLLCVCGPPMARAESADNLLQTQREELLSLKDAAMSATMSKDWAKSLVLYDRYLQLNPYDGDVHGSRGYVLEKMGRDADAICSYKRSAELGTTIFSESWNDLCRRQMLAGRLKEARICNEQIVSVNPVDLSAVVNLGHTYLLEGNKSIAWEWYRKGLLQIDNKATLREGPLADFDIFLKNGWQPELSKEAQCWFMEQGAQWLARKSPADELFKQIKSARMAHDSPKEAELTEQFLSLAIKLYGSEHISITFPLDNLAKIYKTLGQEEKALLLYQRALAIYEKALDQDHFDIANSLHNLAGVYETLGQHDHALLLYQRALKIRSKTLGAEHEDTATSLFSLAARYHILGQYDQAKPLFQRAMAIRTKIKLLAPDVLDSAFYLDDLAGLYQTFNQYDQALLLFQRALAIREAYLVQDDLQIASSLNNLANLYFYLGQYDQALPLLKRALAIKEKRLDPDSKIIATGLHNLANVYLCRGQYDQALPLFQRSLTIWENDLTQDDLVAMGLQGLATMHYRLDQYDQALPLLRRALEILEKTFGQDHPSTAGVLCDLGSTYDRLGQYDQALPLYRRALFISSQESNPLRVAYVKRSLMSFYAKDQPELAIFYGKQVVNIIQGVRRENATLDKIMQESFLKQNEDTYRELADLLFTQGRLMEGQQVLAMLKEAEYFDFIQRSVTDDPRKTLSNYTDLEKSWCERYDKISSQLVVMSNEYQALTEREESTLTAVEKSRLSQLDADLTIGRQRYDKFMVELQREFRRTATSDRLQEFGKKNLDDLSALQGTLGELGHGAVILHYVMTDKRLWILLTTPAIQLKRETAISKADFNRQIGQYREAIARRDPKVKERGKALYDLIIAPVADDLNQAGAQTLMLSLDGAMRYLPMAALYDGEKFLVERYRLATYTEAAKDKLKDDPQAQWKFAGFGLTQKIENFSELKSVRKELEGIAADAMEGDVKFDDDFTGVSFKAALAKAPPVIHLSSHFVFKPGSEADSFLLLGDGNKLSLKQIKDGGYKFTNVDLVTLSACETAVGGGKGENGREVEGFGALAQKQGAKGVVATLWPVNDQSTGEFMRLFYGFRQKNPGMTKAEAMQKAQLAFIEGRVGEALADVSRGGLQTKAGKIVAAVKTTDHPYYWAPFILMGNWL